MSTVQFESEPPGADAKTSNGQTCRTPCALALPTSGPLAVTFTLNGYLPESENIEPVSTGIGMPELRPNPVQVELTPAPPQPKPVKKPPAKKKGTVAKPAAKPKAKTSTAPASAPRAAAQQQQQAPAPWPTTPPPKQ